MTTLLSESEQKEKGQNYLYQLSDKLNALCVKHHLNKNEITAIVYPEVCRYAELQDKIESSAIDYMYIQYGSSTADFSIGHFQMKPSFIEKLENAVKDSAIHEFDTIAKFSSADAKEIRRERTQRLNDENWQLTYLACFYKIMENRFKNTEFTSTAEKVKLFASAYNRGFWEDDAALHRWNTKAHFNFGINSEMKIYGDIAKDYYLQVSAQ